MEGTGKITDRTDEDTLSLKIYNSENTRTINNYAEIRSRILHNLTDFKRNKKFVKSINLLFNSVLSEAESTNLKEIKLIWAELNVINVEGLSFVLPIFRNLEVLILNSNKIGPNGAKILSGNLSYLVNIKVFNISNNDIQDEGIIHLSQSLSCLKNIVVLNLKSNSITEIGVEYLINPLKGLTNLKRFV